MLGDGITNTECEDVGIDLHGSGTMTSNKEILGKRYWRPESEVLEQHRGSERTSRRLCNPSHERCGFHVPRATAGMNPSKPFGGKSIVRSEEHTSELQSLAYLVCRLLLEKKKNIRTSLKLYPAVHHE